jgi:Type ISP C-terminal specificity domain/N-6 DNA Methylase
MADHLLEDYLRELRDVRRSGAAVPETSYYPALAALLDAVGATLKPKVRCIVNPSHGAGIPDAGLFTPEQFQRASAAEPLQGTKPSRGVVEAKPTSDDAFLTADSLQVSKYWKAYGQVLVTNFRDFLLVGADVEGKPVKLEHYRLAPNEVDFWTRASHPRAIAIEQDEAFTDFIKRVMLHAAPLAVPKDVAWFMASYAREALRRVEKKNDVPALAAIRSALEEALRIKFEEKKGDHFFRSTLVQTLFYGVFSAWVLWTREHPATERTARFDWRTAGYYLRVPVLAELFHQASNPASLAGLELPEVLDWTGTVLNRVDRSAFFTAFEEHHAVQYFYEPFLEAYDPELRKQLGVWYTPREVVRYMVARVDRVLREELNLRDGLAESNVYVLDPCCGTGSYLIEVLNRIGETLREKGGDALTAQEIKCAAMERVFGFEILPAPFVVTHLQIGLLLQSLGAPFSDTKKERAGVYLTNALTGWEPPDGSKPQMLLAFPELREERDAAERVKQKRPILVILGNPPYNGFAGLAVDEESDLSGAYRTAKRAPHPQGQGLNDLYVRFYRMAERRIVEQTGSFISNYSWLDGLSFTGMRERYLDRFDRIWIDCLNGDKYKTGKLTPGGDPDPSISSTEFNREGIQVGTVISLLTRHEKSAGTDRVRFRNLWGKEKRAQLLDEAKRSLMPDYQELVPPLELGLPFQPGAVATGYLSWPLLPELFPVSFPGVKTSRDDAVVDVDKERLATRMEQYFDPEIGDSEVRAIAPTAMTSTRGFDAIKTRRYLLQRGFKPENIVRYCYRPFDSRWLYWEPETALLDRKREEYFPQVFVGNIWIEARQRQPMEHFDRGYVVKVIADNFGNGLSSFFPLYLTGVTASATLFTNAGTRSATPNVGNLLGKYLLSVKADPLDFFLHCVAVLHAPSYRWENAGALRIDWPRIPLPFSKQTLRESAKLGGSVAALLDPDAPVDGVNVGDLRPELLSIAIISREGGGSLNPDAGDLDVTTGWGHGGKGKAVMPGKGEAVERDYTAEELEAIKAGAAALRLSSERAFKLLGKRTLDVYLNNVAYWKNIPAGVWEYTIGGYQVIKKWLSYREREILQRGLGMDEMRLVTETARRIASIVLMESELDTNYEAVKRAAYVWPPSIADLEGSKPSGTT